jgi:hypothetical protein
MNIYFKYFVILFLVFIFIVWFQNIDDKKHNKQRETFFEKYKLPLLVCSLVGFFITCNIYNICDNIPDKNVNLFNKQKINIYKPNKIKHLPKEIVFNNSDNSSLQQVYIDMPNF